MEKVFLQSDEEYFAYCEQNQIGHIHRQYGSQSCYIENGIKCSDGATLYKGTHYEEYLGFDSKPSHYPCILVYYDGLDDVICGMFVYQDEFNS